MYRVLALLATGLIAAPVAAQTATPAPCAPRDHVADSLRSNHDEVPVGQGLTSDGSLFEVFASRRGTWTVVITHPSKLACVKASGLAWHETPPVVTELEGPAT